jgi:hypothetical protein
MKLFISTIPEDNIEKSPILVHLRASEHIKDFCAIVFFPMDETGDNIYFQQKRKEREEREQLSNVIPQFPSSQQIELIEEESTSVAAFRS